MVFYWSESDCSKVEFTLGFIRVISCDFVDRFPWRCTDDPRNTRITRKEEISKTT